MSKIPPNTSLNGNDPTIKQKKKYRKCVTISIFQCNHTVKTDDVKIHTNTTEFSLQMQFIPFKEPACAHTHIHNP